MKVEIGKTYRRRDGKVIKIDSAGREGSEFPFYDSTNDNAYRPDGTHGGYHDRDWDLLEEVYSPSMQIQKELFNQLVTDRKEAQKQNRKYYKEIVELRKATEPLIKRVEDLTEYKKHSDAMRTQYQSDIVALQLKLETSKSRIEDLEDQLIEMSERGDSE